MKLLLQPLHNDDLIRLSCEGPVRHRADGSADPFQELMGPLCHHHKVLLSLEHAESVDTSGLDWLLSNHRRFAEEGGKLVLHSIPPVVLDLLRFTHLTDLLTIAPTEQAATTAANIPDPAMA
jgi:anti-anti-sigma factor